MVVPTDPASCLVFIQTALLLGRLNVVLDRPSRGAYLRHFGQWHFRWGIRAMVLQRFGLCLGGITWGCLVQT
jgi:hypothetical protein